MQLVRGLGRKLSFPVLIVSLLGWILYVIGFAVFNNTNNTFIGRGNGSIPEQRASLDYFPHWCILVSGPFMFILTIIHLIIGRFYSGIFTKFLTSLYLVCGGAVVFTEAVSLFSDSDTGFEKRFSITATDWLTNGDYGLWLLIEWVGVLFSVVFLTLFMMMWPCFGKRYSGEEYYEEYEDEEGEGQTAEAEEPAAEDTADTNPLSAPV